MGSLQQHKNMNIDQETYALWRTYGRWEAWYMDKWTSEIARWAAARKNTREVVDLNILSIIEATQWW